MKKINADWYSKGKLDRKLGDQLMKKINFYIQRDFILQKLRNKICQTIILKLEVEQYGI